MYRMLALLADREGIFLEPSALAGMIGPVRTEMVPEFVEFRDRNATHLVWATGGSMVPSEEMAVYYHRGNSI